MSPDRYTLMLSGLLITLDIIVCMALIGVVLMQRSEGGAFGMGGGPTGLVTARGAGDLLTRTTWILFALFLALSLGLTLLGAHDRATSSIVEKLKLQHANPNELNQPLTPPVPAGTAPIGGGPTPGSLVAPPVQSAPAPLSAPAPQPLTTVPNLGAQPRPKPAHAAAPKAETAPAPPVLEPPPPVSIAPPKPASDAPAKPASDAPAPAAP
jgi:preprotein translocase subunit SecG